MGLFSTVCITRPDTAKPAPAITAASTLGTRIFQRMRTLAAVPVLSRASKQSRKLIREEPANRHPKARTTTVSAIPVITMLFFLFFFFSSAAVSIASTGFLKISPYYTNNPPSPQAPPGDNSARYPPDTALK